MTGDDAASPRCGGSPSNAARRARTSALSADVHMLPHLSSEILIWKANSPSFVRGALSPLAGVQSRNEQQLARRPVLGAASLTLMNVSFVACLALAFVPPGTVPAHVLGLFV